MLNDDTSKILQNNVTERINKLFPDGDSFDKLAATIANVATKAAIITLEEYEKLNTNKD